MKGRSSLAAAVVMIMAFLAFSAGEALAHTPLFSCWDNGDGTLSCEGGFSDGSSAAGMSIRVADDKDTALFSGKLDEFGELTFDKPTGNYSVTFDAGPGHSITLKGTDIK